MLFPLPFLTPETEFVEQKQCKKLSLCSSSYRCIDITPVETYGPPINVINIKVGVVCMGVASSRDSAIEVLERPLFAAGLGRAQPIRSPLPRVVDS